LSSVSTLRFRNLEEVEHSLKATGFTDVAVREARTGRVGSTSSSHDDHERRGLSYAVRAPERVRTPSPGLASDVLRCLLNE